MAYVAPSSRSTGDLITAAIWNQDVKDNVIDNHDRLDDVSQTEPVRVLDTVYQNTSGKIRIITITILMEDSERVEFFVENNAAPSIRVARMFYESTDNDTEYQRVTFVVPPTWYYEADIGGGTPTIEEWFEWDLL